MTPPTCKEFDVHWYRRLSQLQNYLEANDGRWPTQKSDRSLFKWVSNQRTRHRLEVQSGDGGGKHWDWRIEDCARKRIDLFRRRVPKQIRPNSMVLWETLLHQWRRKVDARLVWFWAMTDKFKGRSGFLKVKSQCGSLEELLVRWLKIGDVDPTSCTRSQPDYDVRHTLSYILEPLTPPEMSDVLVPVWQFRRIGPYNGGAESVGKWSLPEHTCSTPIGYTCHFDASLFDADEFAMAERDLPDWIRELAYGHRRYSREEIRQKMSEEKDIDHFPVSVLGTNYSKGVQPITSLTHGSPRRLNLFDSVGQKRKSRKHGCVVEDGYSYTLSVTHIPFYGGRNMKNFPGIASLKVHVWKKCWHHLSPISQLCPPNGAQILYYFEEFQGKMNYHNDMNPDMVVSDETNSQIMGSTVIVVTLFVGQLVKLAVKRDGSFRSVAEFLAEHGSVYLLHPHDDFHYYHGTCFSKRKEHRCVHESVRVAITFRWLGNRMSYLGDDYPNVGRRNCQAVADPLKPITQTHKKRPDLSALWEPYL